MVIRSIELLLVEDNEGDIILTLEALKEVNRDNTIGIARDGDEALKYLRKEEPYAEAGTPELILLDINLPKVDGFEVLETIRKDKELMSIPVIILISSDADRDILQSYGGHASYYLKKPVDLESFLSVVDAVKDLRITGTNLPKSA